MFRRNVFAFVCLLAFPITVMAETRVDMDRSKDFRQYKTFSVEVSPPIRNGEVDETNTIAVNRLREAVTTALRARGLTPTDGEADLTLRVASRETERTELVSSWPADPYGWYGPWGYGYGFGYADTGAHRTGVARCGRIVTSKGPQRLTSSSAPPATWCTGLRSPPRLTTTRRTSTTTQSRSLAKRSRNSRREGSTWIDVRPGECVSGESVATTGQELPRIPARSSRRGGPNLRSPVRWSLSVGWSLSAPSIRSPSCAFRSASGRPAGSVSERPQQQRVCFL